MTRHAYESAKAQETKDIAPIIQPVDDHQPGNMSVKPYTIRIIADTILSTAAAVESSINTESNTKQRQRSPLQNRSKHAISEQSTRINNSGTKRLVPSGMT